MRIFAVGQTVTHRVPKFNRLHHRAETEEEPVRVVNVKREEDVLRVEETPRDALAPSADIVVAVATVGNEETCPKMGVNKQRGWAADCDDRV